VIRDPEVRSVETDGGRLVYHVIEGGSNGHAVWCQEFTQHLDLSWTDPTIAEAVCGLARDGLTSILFQPRGVGLSDPIDRPATVAEQATDLMAILRAEGVRRATLSTVYLTALPAALVAAQHPELVKGMVMLVPCIAGPLVDDPDGGWTSETARAMVDRYRQVGRDWGSGSLLEAWDPGLCSPLNRRLMAMLERCTVSPEMARANLERRFEVDGRAIFSQVRVPTRVLSIPGSAHPVAVTQAVADVIPGAEHHVLPPSQIGDSIGMAWRPITRHVAEVALGATVATRTSDRALASVLFVDIVDSTAQLARVGDAEWALVLDRLELLTQRVVVQAGGRYIKSTGDGALCEFASPAQAVESARALGTAATELGVQLRAGVHTGECERLGFDLAGLAVHISARVCALAGPGDVAVSRTVRDLVAGSDLTFSSHGEHELKGVPGRREIFILGTDVQSGLPDTADPRPLDRVVVRMARRAPGTVRAVNRAASAVQRWRLNRT
jgi:class 3 adenylate cyclase/pimeloyl-ACP methyl ester carboxylesterase